MPSFSTANPFARSENHEVQAVWTYKVMTLITWLLSVLVSVYYSVGMPDRSRENGGKTIWMINKTIHTLFSLNPLVTSLYWLFIFSLQIAYIWHLFSPNIEDVKAAVGVGSHFVFNNIAQFSFIFLFVQEHFFWAELVLLINLANLLVLYFGHNTYPRVIHIPITSGPLAWTFVALYWNGATAIHPHAMLAHIVATFSTWGILAYGWFFLFFFKDYTMTLALSILCASLGAEQYLIHNLVWQWSFAFAIMTLLLISTFLVGIPALFGKEFIFKREQSVVPEDMERTQLLAESQGYRAEAVSGAQ